jgi:hypothetical protein
MLDLPLRPLARLAQNEELERTGREARSGGRMGQNETDTTATGKNRIMIFGPKADGTYVIEFRTAAGEALAISIPRTEAAVIRHFQERSHTPGGVLVLANDSGTLFCLSETRPTVPALFSGR